MTTIHRLVIASLLLLSGNIQANNDAIAHRIAIPLYDTPENSKLDFKNLTMNQSLLVTKSFYQFSHYSLQKFWPEESTESLISIIVFDTLSTWLPLSNAWLHEEWHRAVLNQYNIHSYNAVYDLEFFSDVISVNDINDDDLVFLKTNHPKDLIRLHAAGLEAQSQLNLSIEMDKFFDETKSFDYMLLWFNSINSLMYLNTCSTSEANSLTAGILKKESDNIKQRDFTGLDCNAWVYDLFRPDEPYTSRGTHPSGVGIDRYITYDDLTHKERNFLRKQYYLFFLNFLDPFLLSKDYFLWPDFLGQRKFIWNTNVQHYLNPFGYSINWNVFLKNDDHKFKFSLKNHFNYQTYFPGVSVSIFEKPLIFQKTKLSAELSLWQQPKRLDFFTTQHLWGGSTSIGINFDVSKYLVLYTNLIYKTEGWIEGQVDLGDSFNLQAGLLINRFE